MCGFVFEIFYSQQIEVDSEKLFAASRKIRSEMSGRANDKLIFFKSHWEANTISRGICILSS